MTNITDGAAATPTPGTLSGAVLSLVASNEIGTAARPILTGAPTITAAAGAGGAYLSQASGSVSFTSARRPEVRAMSSFADSGIPTEP